MKLHLLFLFLVVSCFVSAQDTIYKYSGDTILAKVLEIGIENVKYSKFDNLDGPVYYLSKWEISSITYQNGATDNFAGVQSPLPQDIEEPYEEPEPQVICRERVNLWPIVRVVVDVLCFIIFHASGPSQPSFAGHGHYGPR